MRNRLIPYTKKVKQLRRWRIFEHVHMPSPSRFSVRSPFGCLMHDNLTLAQAESYCKSHEAPRTLEDGMVMDSVVSTKTCPSCFALYSTSAKSCATPGCTHQFNV